MSQMSSANWRGCDDLRVLFAKGHQKITRQVGKFVPAKRDRSAARQPAVVAKKLKEENIMISASIVVLLPSGSPSTIFWTIVSVVINSV